MGYLGIFLRSASWGLDPDAFSDGYAGLPYSHGSHLVYNCGKELGKLTGAERKGQGINEVLYYSSLLPAWFLIGTPLLIIGGPRLLYRLLSHSSGNNVNLEPSC